MATGPRSLNFTTALPIWAGETAFIIAGGPSLAGFDFSRLAGRRVIAINSSVFSCPSAGVLFFGDERWWRWNADKVKRTYAGRIFTCSSVADPVVHNLVKRRPPPYISPERGDVTMLRTSLTASINLAIHFGCTRLILLGADMKAAANGRAHHHPEYPVRNLPTCWDVQMTELREVAKSISDLGIEIINTSLESRIDWWPKQSIEELL